MTKIHSEHQGKQVELDYSESVAKELQRSNQRIADRFAASRPGSKPALKFQEKANAWNEVIADPTILATANELCKEYVALVCYSESGWDALFRPRPR